jgi:hypothetical protein
VPRDFVYSRHAQEEMVRRGIAQALVDDVLRSPEQVVPEQNGRVAYQSRVEMDRGQIFLLRVLVAESADPAVVVTVYRTSKIAKYWRTTP